jgi:peptide-methionine (S)-S-oxide reductase
MTVAVFGGGCFWCTEAVFDSLQGVQKVEPGYCGGHVDNPSYEQVCNKDTGHIEVIRVTFDPDMISFESLLEVFFATHDPTTPGRQGNDVGPQYESVIFYQDASQLESAKKVIEAVDASAGHGAPVCTQLKPAATFWPAEDYHHDFFARNPGQGYCQFVVAPKVQKFRAKFADRLKRGQ